MKKKRRETTPRDFTPITLKRRFIIISGTARERMGVGRDTLGPTLE
jgi:hypothetical protein